MKNTTKAEAPDRMAYPIPEVCQKLGGIANQTCYNEINSGRLESFRVGKRRFVSQAAIDRYINAREAENAA
jgi:hypothetical protein